MSRRLTIAIPLIGEWVEESYKNYFYALCALDAWGEQVEGDVSPERYDGLLLPGGWDVDPARYGADNTASHGVDPALDATQFGALDAFVKAGKPILGICRGHQIVNVYFGGTLIQHLPQSPTHSRGSGEPDKAHDTTAASGSILYQLYGETFPVNSSHHQGVDRLGAELRVTQRSLDGVIEGMEHERLPLFTVQWHPERMCFNHARPDTVDGGILLRYFLKLCRERRS